MHKEKRIAETKILYGNVCEIFYKISMDFDRNLGTLFEHQFECDMWERLNAIAQNAKEFPTASKYSRMMQQNIRNYYIDKITESLDIFSDDVLFEIASWIW